MKDPNVRTKESYEIEIYELKTRLAKAEYLLDLWDDVAEAENKRGHLIDETREFLKIKDD